MLSHYYRGNDINREIYERHIEYMVDKKIASEVSSLVRPGNRAVPVQPMYKDIEENIEEDG